MRGRVLMGAAATAAALIPLACGPEPATDPRYGTHTTAPAPCREDDPCWDCETMGNRVCGPLPTTD